MLNKIVTSATVILLSLVIGSVHSSFTSATELSAGMSGHTQSKGGTLCQPSCHSDLNQQYSRPIALKKRDRDPLPHPAPLGDVEASYLTTNLLQENGIWKLASWVPPDILLLTSSYSTTL